MIEERSPQQAIFIFGFPRSGTTLLQRVLNSYQDVLIWGEHVSFLKDVANAYFRVWRNPDFFKSTAPLDELLRDTKPTTQWQGWLNWIGEEEWTRLHRQFLDSIFVPGGLAGKRFWGWKEVHYMAAKDEQTLPFLAATYPHAKYVFLVRNGFNTLASFSVWPRRNNIADWKHEGCRRWKEMIRSFRDWHQSGKVESFWIRYEELIEGKGEVLRLLNSMGKRLGTDQSDILQAQTGRGSSFGTQNYHERWRQLSTLRLGVALACFGELNRELGYDNPPVPLHGRFVGRSVSSFLSLFHLTSRLLPRLRSGLLVRS
jgi:hypothetical protein